MKQELTNRIARAVQSGQGMKLNALELRLIHADIKPRPWWAFWRGR